MQHRHRFLISILAAAGCLFGADARETVAPEIRDDAKLFSAGAIKKANERIREIYAKHDRDVLIETFASVPLIDVDRVKAMDTDKQSAYFLDWAKARAKERVVKGVYVLICKEPKHVRVGVVDDKPEKFAAGARNAIEQAFIREFRDNRYDDGLVMALSAVEDKLAKK